jgi:peptidoglycan/xylan/chitin deacetylase (PgdA/CDA1 family)
MPEAAALPILMYHHVSPNPGLVTVSPATFRGQMEALAVAGWRTAGLDAVARFFRGEKLPAKTCIVTFDDGYLDNQVHAAPVLADCGFNAVIFAVTGWLGEGAARDGDQETPDHRECKRRIAAGDADSVVLRWSEAERLQAAGIFEFHSHTHTHIRWDKTLADPKQRDDALASDLAESRRLLETRLGVVSRHLCWPQGYYDEQYVATAKGMGFDHLYTTEQTMNLAQSAVDRIGRFVTKEKSGNWLLRRTRLYATPWLGGLYAALRSAR